MWHQDHEDDDEFLQNLPFTTMDEFNSFDEEINNELKKCQPDWILHYKMNRKNNRERKKKSSPTY